MLDRHHPLRRDVGRGCCLATSLLIGGVVLGSGSAAQAGWSSYSSAISEVDACNQAQYLMPEKAVVQEFRLKSSGGKNGTTFLCKVRWSDKAGAHPTDRPILFPSRVRMPLFAAGWL